MTEVLPLNTTPLPVKLRIEDYLLLDRSGAFDAYAKTELIDGEIFYMNAQHRPHARIKSQLFLAISAALRASQSPFEALVEASIAIPDRGVPEPDIVLTSEPEGEGLIPLGTVALVIEVADTTLTNDLGVKARLYARAGIPECWVADVEGQIIHQLWAPEGGTYAQRRDVAFGERIAAVTVAGLVVEGVLT
ncbi:MAG: Uma2 family endonuclease [Sphingomonas sp.]|nr:Uma2 family endonuclease [Sphingomonas sp.]